MPAVRAYSSDVHEESFEEFTVRWVRCFEGFFSEFFLVPEFDGWVDGGVLGTGGTDISDIIP